MGRTHAVSGAVVWLGATGVLAAVGVHPHATTTAVGAALCAGAALLPDMDHPCSTVARTGGWVSQLLCELIAEVCARIHAATRTPLDRPDLDGHRTATHTAVFAVAAGLVVAALASAAMWVAAGLVAGLIWLGTRGVVRRRRYRAVGVVAALLTGAGAAESGSPGWLLGVAVTVGCVTHCLGDAATNSGCPLLWPLQVYGRRWFPVGTPRWLRFGTGGVAERVVLVLLILAGFGEAGWLVAT
jgi:membrane-bound metal-dependent hydrolase YbcI (DUF457 family)